MSLTRPVRLPPCLGPGLRANQVPSHLPRPPLPFLAVLRWDIRLPGRTIRYSWIRPAMLTLTFRGRIITQRIMKPRPTP